MAAPGTRQTLRADFRGTLPRKSIWPKSNFVAGQKFVWVVGATSAARRRTRCLRGNDTSACLARFLCEPPRKCHVESDQYRAQIRASPTSTFRSPATKFLRNRLRFRGPHPASRFAICSRRPYLTRILWSPPVLILYLATDHGAQSNELPRVVIFMLVLSAASCSSHRPTGTEVKHLRVLVASTYPELNSL